MPTYPITSIEKKAWRFAKDVHDGVKRKFQKSSYFDGHIRKVFGLVKQFTTDPEIGAATLLHDSVEDVEWVTYELLVKEFGKNIANLVKEVTSNDEMVEIMGKPDYLLDKMLTMSEKALIIKLCDRLQNISDSYNASESFREKYYRETKYIMSKLVKNRHLNRSHKRIAEQIFGLLRTIKSRYNYESLNLKHLKPFNYAK